MRECLSISRVEERCQDMVRVSCCCAHSVLYAMVCVVLLSRIIANVCMEVLRAFTTAQAAEDAAAAATATTACGGCGGTAAGNEAAATAARDEEEEPRAQACGVERFALLAVDRSLPLRLRFVFDAVWERKPTESE